MQVAVYSIALNEKQFVDRWFESAAEADYILIADTGSTDGMAEYAEELGITVYKIKVSPWRFDDAKNAALNLLPKDIDIAVSMDMDEVLLPGWREMLEVTWERDATILNHKYRHNGGSWQWHSKIHARHGCKWVGAVHETLSWSIPEKAVWSDGIFLDEWQDTTKSRRSYLKLLHKKIDEGDKDWRTRYFLANDYKSESNWESSLHWRLESYYSCDDGPITKSYIARNIADDCLILGDMEMGWKWLNTSISDSPERESYYQLAKFYRAIDNHVDAKKAAVDCINTDERRDGFTFNPEAWGSDPYDIAALASYYLGDYKDALIYGKQALELDPTNERLISNMEWYEKAIK